MPFHGFALGVSDNQRSIVGIKQQDARTEAETLHRWQIILIRCACVILAGFALAFAQAAKASTVTATLTGTLTDGTDFTGMFGFAPYTDMTGQSFKLVFTFDDTKGQQSSSTGYTSIVSTDASNPGTAVIEINGHSFGFAQLAIGNYTSEAYRYSAAPPNYYGEIYFDSGDGHLGDGSYVRADVQPTVSAPVLNANWEAPYMASDAAGFGNGYFIIGEQTYFQGAANGDFTIDSIVVSGPQETPASLQFVPVTPCRIVDTRNATGAFGGPELAAGVSREFDIPQSACNIPATAVAYSLNATVVPIASLGYLTIWPTGEAQPVVSTLNSDGRVKANATITPAGTNGGVSVYASDATQFILDIDGYFVPTGTSVFGLEFFPLTPCRIADTRNAAGPLGGPSLDGETGRAFPAQSSNCGIPSTAQAYSLNITAVPHASLGFLTAWPSGQTQPVVSTLNSSTGEVTANAAIVPAGSSGGVSIYVSDASDVILDVNGYFAPPATGGLSLYTVTPCRALDTRSGTGAFDGMLAVDIETSSCAPPAAAQDYVLNATVVPAGTLSYLTLWADGGAQPNVSTLNATDGAVTSNMAIVPTTNGTIDVFSTDSTQLILDLSGYFAP
jgi:hypothetical protein